MGGLLNQVVPDFMRPFNSKNPDSFVLKEEQNEHLVNLLESKYKLDYKHRTKLTQFLVSRSDSFFFSFFANKLNFECAFTLFKNIMES
jgi:hypothetical protein